MTATSPEKPTKSPARRALEIVGSAVGIGIVVYVGINVVVPAIASGIATFLMKKTKLVKSNVLMTAISFQAAHVIWMWVGAMLVTAGTAFLAEVGVYSFLLVLLVWRQAKWVVILLIAYQVFGLAINGLQFAEAAFGSLASRALVLHLLLRAGAFIAMVQFLREKPKEDLVSAF